MSNLSMNDSKSALKKTLDDLMKDGSVVTGKDVIQDLQEKERRQKEFDESVEAELRNRRGKK